MMHSAHKYPWQKVYVNHMTLCIGYNNHLGTFYDFMLPKEGIVMFISQHTR